MEIQNATEVLTISVINGGSQKHPEAFALVSLTSAKVVAEFHEFTVSVWSYGLVLCIVQTNPSESWYQKAVLDMAFHQTGNLWEQLGDSNITSD